MLTLDKNYIDGAWVEGTKVSAYDMVNPATEEVFGQVTLSDTAAVDAAVAAAGAAFPAFSATSKDDRIALLGRITDAFKARMPDLTEAIIRELGAPRKLTQGLQVPAGLMQLATWSKVLGEFEFEEPRGPGHVIYEPVGVAAIISSWNYPVNGPFGVLLPALAAGCTVVWKPSEMAAHSATILVEVFEAAGVPAGVVNMVFGGGADVGNHLVTHQDVDMVSFTGSEQTGAIIAGAVGPQIKKVVLELGGKSPYVVLPGADLKAAVADCAGGMFRNTGQTCTSPSRLLVHEDDLDAATDIAANIANALVVGDPLDIATDIGPLGNRIQIENVRNFIDRAVEAGTVMAAGGSENLPDRGFFIRPTVFSGAANDSFAAQTEAFGPVLTIIGYKDEAEAVELANASEFGLAAYVQGPDRDSAVSIARRLQAGMVHINGGPISLELPFGGTKRSGVGRKLGVEGLKEYLEPKSIYG